MRDLLLTPFRVLLTPDGRRAWALMLMAGCSLSMTAYAVYVLWLVKTEPRLAFYLGLCAFGMIAVVTTGYAGLLVKRNFDLNALGVRVSVNDQQIQDIADKVAAAVPPPPPPAPSVVVQTGGSLS